MRFRCRQILVALACLALPLTIVAASGAQVRRGSLAQGYQKPNPSLFGVNTGSFDLNSSDYKKDFSRAKNIGAHWVHFTGGSVHWTSGGSADYTVMDYAVKQAAANGEGILISLGGDPKSCSISPTPRSFTQCPPTKNLSAYKAFVRQEILRYHSKVTYFESWVEPNLNNGFLPRANPSAYANLLKIQYSVFQAVNRQYNYHLKLLFGSSNEFSSSPSSSNGIAVLPFTYQTLQALNGAQAFDGIAVHAYRYPAGQNGPNSETQDNVSGIPNAPNLNGPFPNCTTKRDVPWACDMTWPQELTAYEDEFLYHGYGNNGVEPLWISEFGWPGIKSIPSGQSADYNTFAGQKSIVKDAYTDLLGLKFVQAAFWFNLRDYDPKFPRCGSGTSGRCNPDPPPFGHYGLLQYGGTPKPAGYEFKSLSHANPGR